VLSATALLWASGVLAADKISFGPAPGWVQPAAVPSAAAPTTTPLQLLLDDRELQFSTRDEQVFSEVVVRIQSAQGLQAAGTFELAWNPDTDQVIVHKVQIVRGTQRIDLLATQKFTVARRETKLDYAELDGTLTGVIQPAGLQIGDVLDVAYTVRRRDPVLAGTSDTVLSASSLQPISRVHLRAQWPKSLGIQWRSGDGLVAKESAQGNTIRASNSPATAHGSRWPAACHPCMSTLP